MSRKPLCKGDAMQTYRIKDYPGQKSRPGTKKYFKRQANKAIRQMTI